MRASRTQVRQWHYEMGVVISERYCRAASRLCECRLDRKRLQSPIHIQIHVLSGSVTISWSSKKQPIVALSSIEAEYQGAVVVTCEPIWLKRLLKDLEVEVSDPTTIYCDNLSRVKAWVWEQLAMSLT